MKTVALGKVAKIDRTVANDNECLSLPYVGLEHVEKERGHFADGFVPTPLNMLATNFRFTPKHVLYGKLRPYLNKVVLPSFDGVCTTEILPILPNEEKLDRTFLWAILLSPTFVNWATSQISGANLPRLDPKLLVEYEIPLPPLTEQKRIASLLARADRLRQLRQTAHNLGDALLQSVFLEMFGNPLVNDKGWKVRTLRSVSSKFSDGPFGSDLKSEHYVSEGVRVIRLQNIGVGNLIDNDQAYISEEHFAELSKHRCLPGDVIVGTMGDPNLRAMILPDSIPQALNKADCVQIRVNPKICNNQFICWLVNMPQTLQLASGMIHGQTRARINMGRLAELEVPIPPLSLQEEFAGVVARVESLRGRMGESTRQVEGLFESLLAEAFS